MGLEKYTVDSNVSGHFTASKLGSNLWDHGYPAMLTWKRNWTHPEDGFSRDSMSTKRVSFLPLPRDHNTFPTNTMTPLGSTRCSRCIKSTTRRLLSPQPAVKNRPMLSAKIVTWKRILAYACHVGIHTQCSYMSSKAAQSPFPGKRFGVTLRRWIDVPATSSSYSCDFDTDISRWSNLFS